MRGMAFLFSVFGLVLLFVFAVVTNSATVTIKQGQTTFVNISLPKASNIYTVETKLSWPNDILKLVAVTKAYNTDNKLMLYGIRTVWKNVNNVDSGNILSYGFIGSKTGVAKLKLDTLAFDEKGRYIPTLNPDDVSIRVTPMDYSVKVESVISDKAPNDLSRSNKVLDK